MQERMGTALMRFLLLVVFLCIGSVYSSILECPWASEVHNLPTNLSGLWRENRLRLATLVRPSFQQNSIIFLTGGIDGSRDAFRQNSNFYYVSGANMPGYFISLFLNANQQEPNTTLFVPDPSADYAVWNGRVYTKAQLQVIYDVDQVLYKSELSSYVAQFSASTYVYTIPSSVSLPSQLSKFTINSNSLNSHMITARATKSDKEVYLMSLVNRITSNAHIRSMQFIASRLNGGGASVPAVPQSLFASRGSSRSFSEGPRDMHVPLDEEAIKFFAELNSNPLSTETALPSIVKTSSSSAENPLYEYEVEGMFLFQSALCGAVFQAYLPIVGAGNNGAILHYIANNEEIHDGQMLLIDAGAEYWGYGSDVTRTYPVNGVFTATQKIIYSIVLRAQQDVVAVVRAGVTWNTLNTIARESITKYMLEAQLLQGTLSELMSNGVYNVFYPHGIGHSVGLDVHDAQTNTLAANQVITVEPGVYFNDYLLDQAKAGSRSKYIVWSRVDALRGFGGVRIEDCYVITATGSTLITTVPSSIDAIEKLMKV